MTGGGTNTLRISAPISVGSMVELIKDRLYYATYEITPSQDAEHHYFCIDDDYHYESFFSDFGPFNLAVLYRYCTRMQRKLKLVSLAKKCIVQYSSPAGQKRVNSAYLIGSFAIIYLNKTAEEVCRLFTSAQPPTFIPFRDAAAGPSMYDLSIFDVFRSLEKAVKFTWLTFDCFDVEEYELYEKVENGDFNWIIPGKILAFCGPHSKAGIENGYPHHSPETYFDYFRKHNVTSIVRLNKKLYDATRFTNAGFQHFDLFFVDGSTPSDAIVYKFIDAVEKSPGALAVHCKAGLGRTGTLIACYMMKHYKMTAAECMAWIRICRPGCIIGPQQQFLVDKQEWCYSLATNPSNSGNISQIMSKVDDIKITENNNQILTHTRSVLPGVDKETNGIVTSPSSENNNAENSLDSEGLLSQGEQLMRIKAHRSSGRFNPSTLPTTESKTITKITKPVPTTRNKKNTVFSLISAPIKNVTSSSSADQHRTTVTKSSIETEKNNQQLPSPSTPTFGGPVRKAAKHKQGSDVTSSVGKMSLTSSSIALQQQLPPNRRLAVPSAVKAQSAPSSSKVVVVSSVDVLGVDKMTVSVANGRTNRASRSSTTNKSMLANNNSSPAYFLRHRFYQNPYQNVQQQKNNSSTTVVTNNNIANVRSMATRKLPTVYKATGSRRSLS